MVVESIEAIEFIIITSLSSAYMLITIFLLPFSVV